MPRAAAASSRSTTGGGNCSGSAPAPKSGGGGGSCGGGGGNCGTVLSTRKFGGTCGWPPPPPSTFYSAPSDNKCSTLGGCAVPISASQLYPTEGVMQIFDFQQDDTTKAITSDPICRMRYQIGEPVHAVAYKAFEEVMTYRQTAGQAQSAAERPQARLPARRPDGAIRRQLPAEARPAEPRRRRRPARSAFRAFDAHRPGCRGASTGSRSSARISSIIAAMPRTCWSGWRRTGRW